MRAVWESRALYFLLINILQIVVQEPQTEKSVDLAMCLKLTLGGVISTEILVRRSKIIIRTYFSTCFSCSRYPGCREFEDMRRQWEEWRRGMKKQENESRIGGETELERVEKGETTNRI